MDTGKTNLQVVIDKQRAVYQDDLDQPLISQICKIHGVSIREFAAIFEISKSHAEEIMKHRKMPSLELALRICRYWEVTVEDMFGWRVDDDGQRRPLLIAVEKTNRVMRLNTNSKSHSTMGLVKEVARVSRRKREEVANDRDVGVREL